MPVTDVELMEEVGADPSRIKELQRCVSVALPLLVRHVFGDVDQSEFDLTAALGEKRLPVEVWDEAHLVAAAEIFHQRKAPNGVLNQQYSTGDGSAAVPVRISRDPLKPAYPILRPWVSFAGKAL